MTPRTTPLLERFLNTLEDSVVLSGCWVWKGVIDGKGYGAIWESPQTRKYLRAHRMSYAHAYGPIDPELKVRHKCDNPPCVRPDHLELGTQKDNIQDAARRGRMNPWKSQVTHCPRDHEYDATSVRIDKRTRSGTSRRCRTCANAKYPKA